MIPLGIAAEAASDARVVCALADRLVVHGRDWISDEDLAVFRSWRGPGSSAFLDLHHARREARARGLRLFGFFGGNPGKEDALLFRFALTLFAEEEEPPAVVVIARDVDDVPGRIDGFRQAAGERTWPFIAVLAAPAPETEAWMLSVFVPQDDAEHERLAELRAELGFDPTKRAHELKHGRDDAKRNCKRVLSALCADADAARERFASIALPTLEACGSDCGLTAFIHDFQAAATHAFGKATP